MTTSTQEGLTASPGRCLLNKVPEVTIYFWIIKVLPTTVGETAADFLNANLNLGVKLNAVLAFWVAYILNRPLGASTGDYLSQSWDDSGLGLGTVSTSALFLIAILGLVICLTITRKDEAAPEAVTS